MRNDMHAIHRLLRALEPFARGAKSIPIGIPDNAMFETPLRESGRSIYLSAEDWRIALTVYEQESKRTRT